MNIKKWTALILVAASPAGLFASSDTDHKIEESAKDSYNYKTVLNDKVDVSSRDGVVTLTGKVQDRQQRDLAADTVANLPGVVSVNNEIVVLSDVPEHSDKWIGIEIRSRLLVKAHVSATSTTVDVNDGVVTLSGTANSSAQKDLTEFYAKGVEGVRSVTNNITVLDNPPKETVGENIDDASITGQVKFELASHGSTSAMKTKVETQNGVVTIHGVASNEAEKTLVTKLAESIRGVTSVDNRMRVAD
jgi:hyperosmotically inducible periplasmic protein